MQKRSARRVPDHGRKKWSKEQRRRRRDLGQNFLKEGRVARRIVEESGVGRGDVVVELGAGGGMLTRELAKAARTVVAVECDPYWVRCLREIFRGDDGVRVVRQDVLKVELPGGPFRVVANVPFHITTSILHRLLDDPASSPETACLVVQEQVALKHARPTPTTLKTLNWAPWYEFSANLALPAGAFDPRPTVGARLMVTARRRSPLLDPRHRHLFRALVRRGFGDNTVGKALRPIYTRTQLRRLAGDNGFSLDVPPSTLTVRQWAETFDLMRRIVPPQRWPSANRTARGRTGRR